MAKRHTMSFLIGLATAAVAIAALATHATGQTEMHVLAGYARVTTVDIRGDGELGPGDLLVARGPAWDEAHANRLGSVHWDCSVDRRVDGDGLLTCDAVLTLADGQIMMRGLDPEGVGGASLAVIGGTGTYSAAQGDGVWTDFETDDGWVTDIVIHLGA